MRQSKVTLLIRMRTADGRQPYCKPVWLNRNKLKPLWAFVHGKPERRFEGVYHLRYTYKGQRRWEALGKSAATAISTRKEREWQLNNMESLTFIKSGLREKLATEPPNTPGRLTLEEAVSKYLAFRKGTAIRAHLASLHAHVGAIPAVLLEEILGRNHET
jgi:hypothetical protein